MFKIKKTTNPIAIRSQEMLIKSFKDLIYEYPYEKVTVRMICDVAQIDRRTYYRYFENKNDILLTLFDQLYVEYIENMKLLADKNKDSYVFLFFKFWGIQHSKVFIALHENGLFNKLFDIRPTYLKEISMLIDSSIGRSSNKCELAYRFGGLINLLSLWLIKEQDITIDQITNTAIRLLK